KLDHLLELGGSEVQTLIMIGVNHGEPFARIGIERVLLQMFDVFCGDLCRIRFLGQELLCVLNQAQIANTFFDKEFLVLQCGGAFGIGQVRNALSGSESELSIREQSNNLLERAAGGIVVTSKFELPIGQRIEREGDVFLSMAWLGAE